MKNHLHPAVSYGVLTTMFVAAIVAFLQQVAAVRILASATGL